MRVIILCQIRVIILCKMSKWQWYQRTWTFQYHENKDAHRTVKPKSTIMESVISSIFRESIGPTPRLNATQFNNWIGSFEEKSFFSHGHRVGSILTFNYKLSVGTINPFAQSLIEERDQFNNNNIRRLMRERSSWIYSTSRLAIVEQEIELSGFCHFFSCAWDETGRKQGNHSKRTNRWITNF